MSLTLFLALRHLRAPRRSRAITLTALVATGGIFVGVLALTLILSVMNGMESELSGLINDGDPHIELRPTGPVGIAETAPILEAIVAVAGVAGAAPFVRSEVLAVHQAGDGRKHLETATFIGIDPELEPTVTRNLDIAFPSFQGFTPDPDWQLLGGSGDEEGLLLGVELAAGLRIGIGERLQLIIPDAASSRASNLDSIGGRHVWRRVLGLIDGGLYEFNATRAYGEIGPTLDFLSVAGEAQGIGVRCVRPERASALADSLLALPALRGYEAETWQSRNQVLFEAMAREKMLMYLFLLLTVGVASLGIVGTMTLMISERRPQIGILRTLGMQRRAVMAMVVLEGWLVGIAGVAGGLAGGWGLGVLLREHPLRIPWDLFVIETVPILLNPIDFIWVGSITLAVSLLAALYPGWEAARMDPIKAIRSI